MTFAEIRRFVSLLLPYRIQEVITKWRLFTMAKMTNSVFACNALQGNSDYNVCINSDITVSCNCQDYDGRGRIGSLSSQTLKEIFNGEAAQNLRKRLAACEFPVPVCAKCNELHLIKKSEINNYLSGFKVPKKGIMLENSVLCNLNCLGCRRDQVLRARKKHKITLVEMEKIAKIIQENRIEHIAFFNLGEPFFSKDVADEIAILRRYNPDITIHTSTNGVYLDSDEKREAALLLDLIYFSIDGPSQEILTRYQVGGSFEKAYLNMKKLVDFRNSKRAAKPVIEWKYVLFRWNDRPQYIQKAIQLAEDAQVDTISFWPGGGPPSHRSFRYWFHPYFDQSGIKLWKGRRVLKMISLRDRQKNSTAAGQNERADSVPIRSIRN